MDLKTVIRDIPDFPKPGILFRDITTLLADPAAFHQAIAGLANPFRQDHIDVIAAAEARGVLLQLASEMLSVPASRLETQDGVIFDRKNEGKRVTYGALAKGKRIARHLTVKPELKDVSQFRIMGQPKLRRDSLEKVTGKAKYAADIRLPGMLYARILRPPAHDALLGRNGARARMKWFHDHGYGNAGATSGHLVPGYEHVLKIGWQGIHAELKTAYDALSPEDRQGPRGNQLRAMIFTNQIT